MLRDWSEYSSEERRKMLEEQYRDITYQAGKSHEALKFIRALRRNSKLEQIKGGYQVIIEGLSLLEAALRYNVALDYLFICPEHIYSSQARQVLAQLVGKAKLALMVSEKTFELISAKDNSNGLIAIGNVKEQVLQDLVPQLPDILIILDGLETPGNIGTILRSADAVNAGGVVLTNRQARLYHPLMVRSSRGACFRIPIIDSDISTVAQWLAEHQYEIVLADTAASEFYYQHQYQKRTAIVMGSERFGISADWYQCPHTKIAIPMYGDCDSLNVGIATTVLLYEMRLKKNQCR